MDGRSQGAGAYELSGKVALVTGAERGIGFAVAQELQARGASVALVDLDEEQAAAAAGRLDGGRAVGIGADVTDAEAIESAVARTVDELGGLDVCVANAGIAPTAVTLRASDPRAFERVVEVNLLGVYRTVRAALPYVIERRGHLSVVASIYAFANGVLAIPYAATKAAVEQLGRALRVELAPHGVSVSVAYYGFVETEMVRQAFDADALATRLEEEQVPRFVRKRLAPERAAKALVAGIEQRSPAVYAPRWLRLYSVLRGLANPLLDRHLARRQSLRELLREADAEGR
jgi:NAD(P)-dependent dehydrogenase (short-subunit alcohol dehydrogenase family)